MAPAPDRLLSGMRLGVGAGAWLAPNLTGRAFGLDPVANPQAAFLARLFGARDLVMAVGVRATHKDSRPVWWQLGIACDLLDVTAAYLAQRNGTLPRAAAVMACATSLAAAGLGVAAMSADG